ncbi:MAG: DUF975 family protein [Oscillospiraceae bacterium]|nr:DUF975 family protein [Oscillospiraceae bacterium]
MTFNNKQTKLHAKQLTQGHRGTGFALLTISFAVATAAGALPFLHDFTAAQAVAVLPYPHTDFTSWAAQGIQLGIALLLVLLVALLVAPLRVGREAWYFGGADARKRTVKRVTFWLQPRWALKAAGFVISLRLRKLLWALLFFVPGGFLLGGTLWQAQQSNLDIALFIAALAGGVVLLLVGAGFYAATVQRYALVLPILAKQPRCKLRNAVRLSCARTNEQCAALLRYKLSFLPWYLLCMLVVPLPFVLPYLAQARACRHAELLRGGV